MNELTFILVNDGNKLVARSLLAEYGRYLFDELHLMAGNETFFKELDKFPDKKYQPPNGVFFIVYHDDLPIGCVGLKRFDESACELKRMYIKEQYRGKGYAKTVIRFIVNEAERLGFTKILLDTNIEMPAAVNAYLRAGFAEIPPYCENDNANPVFFEYRL